MNVCTEVCIITEERTNKTGSLMTQTLNIQDIFFFFKEKLQIICQTKTKFISILPWNKKRTYELSTSSGKRAVVKQMT